MVPWCIVLRGCMGCSGCFFSVRLLCRVAGCCLIVLLWLDGLWLSFFGADICHCLVLGSGRLACCCRHDTVSCRAVASCFWRACVGLGLRCNLRRFRLRALHCRLCRFGFWLLGDGLCCGFRFGFGCSLLRRVSWLAGNFGSVCGGGRLAGFGCNRRRGFGLAWCRAARFRFGRALWACLIARGHLVLTSLLRLRFGLTGGALLPCILRLIADRLGAFAVALLRLLVGRGLSVLLDFGIATAAALVATTTARRALRWALLGVVLFV